VSKKRVLAEGNGRRVSRLGTEHLELLTNALCLVLIVFVRVSEGIRHAVNPDAYNLVRVLPKKRLNL
jgi:hypothetical protein